MGTAAVKIVLDGIRALQDKKDFRAVRERLVPELVVRESTRPVS
jgi:DNA-binding LacI/PurR family transcriptional regulator